MVCVPEHLKMGPSGRAGVVNVHYQEGPEGTEPQGMSLPNHPVPSAVRTSHRAARSPPLTPPYPLPNTSLASLASHTSHTSHTSCAAAVSW